jgi:hypothetical protein
VRGLKASQQLAPYDRAPLERELNLMPEWFLGKHLGMELTPEERAMVTVTNEVLINEAQIQPQVFVHRDFHSRNLMVLPPGIDNGRGPGVIDFQDALRGPIGYDLVSLLKDCYISWSRERVERWVKGYRRVLGGLGANVGGSEYQFLRWFDFIGVQRHIKVLGIFARLWHRDGKLGYLDDLPLVMSYVLDACARYPELVEFGRWLEWRVAPELPAANDRQKLKALRQAEAASKRAAVSKRRPATRKKPAVRKARLRKASLKKAAIRKPAVRKPAAMKNVSKRRKSAKKAAKAVRRRKPTRKLAAARVTKLAVRRPRVKSAGKKRSTPRSTRRRLQSRAKRSHK